MGTLNIVQFEGTDPRGSAPIMPPLASEDLSINASASTATASALNAKCRLLRLTCDEACYVAVGTAPTAAAGALKLEASVPEYVSVDGGTNKVAGLDVA